MMPKTTCGYYTGDGVKIYITDTTTGEKTELGGVQEFKIEKGQLYCDDNVDAVRYTYGIRGGERNMGNKLVDLYFSRKRDEIIDRFNKLVDEKYEQLNVVKEYNELVNTFTTSLAEMADRYNTEETKMLLKTGYMGEYNYDLNPNLKDNLREAFEKDFREETKTLELLIEEVRAQLSLSDDKDYQIDILTRYEIINKKGKLNV